MAILRDIDSISSKEGELYVTANGRKMFMAEIIKFDCGLEKVKAEIKSVGRRVSGSKTVGAKITGSMEYYFVRSQFQEDALEYIKSGKDTYYEAVVMNDDSSSDAGVYRVLVSGINFDNIPLAFFDASSDDVLKASINFTASDAVILDKLNKINY